MSGRRVAILRALTRPPHILHCDRELFLILVGIALIVFFRFGLLRGSLEWMVGSIVFGLLSIGSLAWAHKKDPQWKDVLFRSWRHQPLWGSHVHYSRTPRFDARQRPEG